jgi:mannan endo-1,4-beta-mannosidase
MNRNPLSSRAAFVLSGAAGILFLASGCVSTRPPSPAAESEPSPTAAPTTPTAAASASDAAGESGCRRTLSPDAEAVLRYLDDLTWGDAPGVIAGQDCPQWNGICDPDAYQYYIGNLHAGSGKWIGILHVDYEYTRMFSAAELRAANKTLIAHWQAGGLVAVSWGPMNPWGLKIDRQYSGTDLDELLPGGSRRNYWLDSLDRVAQALAELRDAGVVVLWRPMQEMNGAVYWWAKRDGLWQAGHEEYIRLWRDLFRYFTCAKGLTNLLWVFSPAGDQTWSAYPYPGDAFVDIVAGTSYDDRLEIGGYADFLAFGKPAAVAEYGWGYADADGSHDNRLIVERLRKNYPRIGYWVSWNSWPGFKMSLVDNLFADELMNDPDVIDRDEIRWR